MQSLLAGVHPADSLTFSTAALLCLITALLGTFSRRSAPSERIPLP